MDKRNKPDNQKVYISKDYQNKGSEIFNLANRSQSQNKFIPTPNVSF